ncbi:MAG: tRNA (adenosine(37)-N6)-threonylcarbamoyltransferase complex ATPase subunit type 1 TsaE [Candidatus Saccharibacteria bacterium]
MMFLDVINEDKMKEFGQYLGSFLIGGEIIELIGDVGAGKTTLAKGIAIGLEVSEYVQSPSFTISRVYDGRDDLKLAHYDFYRLNDAGVMADELSETMADKKIVTLIEWADVASGVLPVDRLSIMISAIDENSRKVEIKAGGEISSKLLGKLQR